MTSLSLSSILAWEILWTKEPGGLQSMEAAKESDTTERLHFHFMSYLPQIILSLVPF